MCKYPRSISFGGSPRGICTRCPQKHCPTDASQRCTYVRTGRLTNIDVFCVIPAWPRKLRVEVQELAHWYTRRHTVSISRSTRTQRVTMSARVKVELDHADKGLDGLANRTVVNRPLKKGAFSMDFYHRIRRNKGTSEFEDAVAWSILTPASWACRVPACCPGMLSVTMLLTR